MAIGIWPNRPAAAERRLASLLELLQAVSSFAASSSCPGASYVTSGPERIYGGNSDFQTCQHKFKIVNGSQAQLQAFGGRSSPDGPVDNFFWFQKPASHVAHHEIIKIDRFGCYGSNWVNGAQPRLRGRDVENSNGAEIPYVRLKKNEPIRISMNEINVKATATTATYRRELLVELADWALLRILGWIYSYVVFV